MSSLTGMEIYFKNEYMQYTGWYLITLESLAVIMMKNEKHTQSQMFTKYVCRLWRRFC